MSSKKVKWVCGSCGGESPKFSGRCPACNEWNTMSEVSAEKLTPSNRHSSWAGSGAQRPVKLKEVEHQEFDRRSTGIAELDRVLGGGLVHDSVTLLGGDPGIGKSTLLMQASKNLIDEGCRVLYISGEESPSQIRARSLRLFDDSIDMDVCQEVRLEGVMQVVDSTRPDLVIVDSIQTIYTDSLQSAPGSVAQVRDCAAMLTRMSKSKGIATILVGHVTKEGTLAGPRVLEHIVDTVLYFEGDESDSFRLVRATKNRFGALNELGVFAMGSRGLEEVTNPSSLFLTPHERPVPGCCITAAMEGSRAILVEVQALVEDTASSNPKRFASGVDTNRLQMLLAILHKHAGVVAAQENVYLKVVGGMKLSEPGVDLALLMAVYSSISERALPSGMVAIGEVGLAGEVRPVRDVASRLREAAKLGFKTALVPAQHRGKVDTPGLKVAYVSRVADIINILREMKEAA